MTSSTYSLFLYQTNFDRDQDECPTTILLDGSRFFLRMHQHMLYKTIPRRHLEYLVQCSDHQLKL